MGATNPAIDPAIAGVELERWLGRFGRDLPWRATRDPWAILVAELMSQQTQVDRVAQRWVPFLQRFPDAATMAAAPVATVIAEWAGLGYNRRALNLHRSAVAIVERHDGRLPRELDALLALPGIGPYTARAIRVFAFETDDGVLDTNVGRILARTEGLTLGRSQAQLLADSLVPAGSSWAWNSALLDIGSAYCRARSPQCWQCPLRERCRWHQRGLVPPDPAATSAGVSVRQSPFVGSDRQGRGRLVDALRGGPVARRELATVMGWPQDDDRARRVAATLVQDGLVVDDGDTFSLPN